MREFTASEFGASNAQLLRTSREGEIRKGVQRDVPTFGGGGESAEHSEIDHLLVRISIITSFLVH